MSGKVYLLQELGLDGVPTGLYKIGRTTAEVEARKGQYRAGNARVLKNLGHIDVADSQAVETALHRYFAEYRVKNPGAGDEWFYFGNVDLDWVIGVFDQYEEAEPVREPEPTYSNYSGYSTPSYSYSDSLPWEWIVGIGAVVLFGFGAIVAGGRSMQSREGEDRKVTQTEVSRYALAGQSINAGGNPSDIAKHFQAIASATQVPCIKSFAVELRDKAESRLDMRKEIWEVRQKYLHGRCEPIKVLDDLSGYSPRKPQEAVVESPKIQPIASSKAQANAELKAQAKTAIVQSNRPGTKAAFLRQTPNGKLLGRVLNGRKVEVLEVGDGWTKVHAKLYEGGEATGWVYSEFIRVVAK